MTLRVEMSADESVATIYIIGRFDFNIHQEFRKAYEKVKSTASKYIVNLADTQYIDSSALGMLLLLRDSAGGDKSDVTIITGNEEVKKILTISNFEKLFRIA